MTEPHTAVVISDPLLRRDKIRVVGVCCSCTTIEGARPPPPPSSAPHPAGSSPHNRGWPSSSGLASIGAAGPELLEWAQQRAPNSPHDMPSAPRSIGHDKGCFAPGVAGPPAAVILLRTATKRSGWRCSRWALTQRLLPVRRGRHAQRRARRAHSGRNRGPIRGRRRARVDTRAVTTMAIDRPAPPAPTPVAVIQRDGERDAARSLMRCSSLNEAREKARTGDLDTTRQVHRECENSPTEEFHSIRIPVRPCGM